MKLSVFVCVCVDLCLWAHAPECDVPDADTGGYAAAGGEWVLCHAHLYLSMHVDTCVLMPLNAIYQMQTLEGMLRLEVRGCKAVHAHMLEGSLTKS